LTLLRGCLVMLPLLGLSATLPWLAAAVTTVAALTGWLVTKAALLYQLSAGKSLLIAQTGVVLHLPTVLAAEVLGIFMAWFLLALVWINRRVMQQPAAGDPILALHTRTAALAHQRMAVQEWVVQQEPAGVGPELTAPLLAAAAAEAGEAGPSGMGVEEEAVSMVSAHSRQASNTSWVTAPESLSGVTSLPAAPSADVGQ
jgi:hypothetical protein